ncbi:MAG: hypothetical protein DLM70_10715 [Chloroflexi bacterium]|nr:MAG: hypothetical protein DLM70_10715 [Chloroflexota bacterium]
MRSEKVEDVTVTGEREAGSQIKEVAADLLGRKVVDLSPRLEAGIPRWPTHPHTVIDPTVVHEHDGYYCQSISMAEHTGSHVDTPSHVHADRMHQTLDHMSLTQLIGRAVVYHLGSLRLQAGESATRDQILEYEQAHGVALKQGDIALLDFDWMRYWTTTSDAHWYAANQPGLDEDAVRLFQEREVKAVGADTIACETVLKDGKEISAYGHKRYWLPNGIYIMEELANLSQIPTECLYVALPLRIANGSGSPIRAVAFLP